MLGCKGSAAVFSPESSLCLECPHYEGCHEAALSTTRRKREGAEAAFLSVQFATAMPDLDDEIAIAQSTVSARVKRHAESLIRRGVRFADVRRQLDNGINPFASHRTVAAFIEVYDALLERRHVRKCDLVQRVMARTQTSKSTASSLVSDALGLGQLMGVVDVMRLTATLKTGNQT